MIDSASKRDQQGMRRLGFTQILSTTTKYKNFVIDMNTSGLDIALQYEEALNNWRIQYEEE